MVSDEAEREQSHWGLKNNHTTGSANFPQGVGCRVWGG